MVVTQRVGRKKKRKSQALLLLLWGVREGGVKANKTRLELGPVCRNEKMATFSSDTRVQLRADAIGSSNASALYANPHGTSSFCGTFFFFFT